MLNPNRKANPEANPNYEVDVPSPLKLTVKGEVDFSVIFETSDSKTILKPKSKVIIDVPEGATVKISPGHAAYTMGGQDALLSIIPKEGSPPEDLFNRITGEGNDFYLRYNPHP